MDKQKITGKISYDQWAPRTPFHVEVFRHWPGGEYQTVGHASFNDVEECEEWLISAHKVNPDMIAITEGALTAQRKLEAEAIANSNAMLSAVPARTQAGFADFLIEAIAGATGEGAICVHVRGSLVLLTERRWYDGDDLPPACGRDYFHKLASWPASRVWNPCSHCGTSLPDDQYPPDSQGLVFCSLACLRRHERANAPLVKPQGANGVRVDGWMV